MSEKQDSITKTTASYFNRVWRSDSTRRGLAAAGAGVLIAVISELAWPARS
jgi:hypothetical protein